MCPALLAKTTGCWQGGSECVHSSAPSVHLLFSWCRSRPTGKIRCDTHPQDPSPKSARRDAGRGRGAASAVSQIREQACHSRKHALTATEGGVYHSFVHTLLADILLMCGKGAATSENSGGLQLRKATRDSCLSERMFISKIPTSQNLEFNGPGVWVTVKIIYVKIKKSLPVTTDGPSPS